MSRWGGFALLVLVSVTVTSPATAQWAWRDKAKDNQVTYSDRPPPSDVPDKDILKRPNQPATYAPAPAVSASEAALSKPRLVDTSLEAKRKEAEKQAAAQKKMEADKIAAARAENCERTRKQLRALESGARMSSTNAKGELEPMDDAARAAEVARAREVVASDCK